MTDVALTPSAGDEVVAQAAAEPALIDAPEVQPSGQGQQGAGAPDVQPSGQGDEVATETGLYDLSTVPEDQRGYVEPILKEIERNTNAKFRQHAADRQTWEPYEALGVTDLDPEGLGALIGFAEALDEDPRAAIVGLAQTFGVDLGEVGDEPAEDDPVADLRAEVESLRAWRDERVNGEQENDARAEAAERIQTEWSEVQQLHGRDFTEAEVLRLRTLATTFLKADSETPIKDAYEYITGLTGQAATDFVAGAPTQPAPAEPAGRASTTAVPVDDIEEAQRLHGERRRARAAHAA